MSTPTILNSPSGRSLAYYHTNGRGPLVVFLGGFMSDMTGSKATYLEDWAKAAGRAYLRLDYSGHGVSGGAFQDGCIGDWAADAQAVIDHVTEGPVVLVGSSMGGWISLLTIKALGARVQGLVTIAAAPDFTEDGYWAEFSEADRAQVMEQGHIPVPSDYGDPYIITRHLIEDGRKQLVLRDPLHLPMPVRFLQGAADTVVPVARAVQIMEHVTGPDVHLTIQKDADHSMSDEKGLSLIVQALEDVLARIG